MPKETRTTIWVVGAEGSGKTTLITLFPLAALRLGWILIPDQDTARYIYRWQHDLFSRGMFPPKGDAQRSDDFAFSNFKPADWEMSQLGNGRLRTQRTVTVVEHSLSSDYDNVAFEEQLMRQANINEEFGITDPVHRRYNVLAWVRGYFQDRGENHGHRYEALKQAQIRLSEILESRGIG